MAIPIDELLQEDFSFPVQGYDIEQIRQTIANRIPLVGSQRGVYGGGPIGGGTGGGSYTPYVGPDTTYSSGFDYARSIAGGIPASQMIQSGVSYSPDMPGGYDQEFLNRPSLPPQPQPFPIAGPITPPLPMSRDAVSAEPLSPGFQLPNFFANIPKFDPSKLQNFSGIKLFDFDPSKLSQSTPSVENNLGIPNFSIETAAPGFSLSSPMDQPMMGEDGLIPLERPNLPQPNFVPPTMTPPAPVPSAMPSVGGVLQMPTISPITPNINFVPPVVEKPIMPKQEGLFPSVGRGISAVRGAQEGFDQFKEGLKKKAIQGLFGIG